VLNLIELSFSPVLSVACHVYAIILPFEIVEVTSHVRF
jgi:hypothetical protein